MEVIIRPTRQDAVDLTAKIIEKAIRERPDIVLGLATGRTMEDLYAELSRKCREEQLDFSLVRSFNLDEYVGLPPEHPGSYRYYMNYHLFNNVNIDLRNTHLPNGVTDDLDGEGQRYEDEIKHCGGVDLQLLGIGRSGHIGFNEPLSPFRSRTRHTPLTPVTFAQNSPLFDKPEDMPRRAFTMGVGTILDARRIVMLVTGEEKADILAKAVEGPMTSMVSGSAIQLHPDAVVIVDEEAAANLQGKDYYHWVFDTDPKWEEFR